MYSLPNINWFVVFKMPAAKRGNYGNNCICMETSSMCVSWFGVTRLMTFWSRLWILICMIVSYPELLILSKKSHHSQKCNFLVTIFFVSIILRNIMHFNENLSIHLCVTIIITIPAIILMMMLMVSTRVFCTSFNGFGPENFYGESESQVDISAIIWVWAADYIVLCGEGNSSWFKEWFSEQ